MYTNNSCFVAFFVKCGIFVAKVKILCFWQVNIEISVWSQSFWTFHDCSGCGVLWMLTLGRSEGQCIFSKHTSGAQNFPLKLQFWMFHTFRLSLSQFHTFTFKLSLQFWMLRSGQIMILVLCLFYNQVQDDMDDLKRKEQCSRHCSESCMERVIKSMAPFHRTVLCNKVLLHKSLFSKLNKVGKGYCWFCNTWLYHTWWSTHGAERSCRLCRRRKQSTEDWNRKYLSSYHCST